jgi:GNAT superfamily N-acetyltransferase
MPYAIRAASADDVPVLVQHRELMFREMGTQADWMAMADGCARWYREAMAAGTLQGWLAELDGTAVGGGGLIVLPWSPGPTRFDPRMGWVINVFVDPAHRGHGLARRLMEAMHAWCREQGIQRIALNATAAGEPTYRALGYAALHEPMMRLDL